MPVNWPPVGMPSWPPSEVNASQLSCSDIRTLVNLLKDLGFTHAAPTSGENASYFSDARCDHGDTVIGRMLVSPGGTRYPVAICTDASHRDVLVPWFPYYCGARSGENFVWV